MGVVVVGVVSLLVVLVLLLALVDWWVGPCSLLSLGLKNKVSESLTKQLKYY